MDQYLFEAFLQWLSTPGAPFPYQIDLQLSLELHQQYYRPIPNAFFPNHRGESVPMLPVDPYTSMLAASPPDTVDTLSPPLSLPDGLEDPLSGFHGAYHFHPAAPKTPPNTSLTSLDTSPASSLPPIPQSPPPENCTSDEPSFQAVSNAAMRTQGQSRHVLDVRSPPGPEGSLCKCFPAGTKIQRPDHHWKICKFNPNRVVYPCSVTGCHKFYTTRWNLDRHAEAKH